MNNSPANVKLSKTQLSKMIQLDGFLGPLSDLSLLLNPELLAKKYIDAL